MEKDFLKNILKSFTLALLALFLLPASSLFFISYGERQLNSSYQEAFIKGIDQDSSRTEQEKQLTKDFIKFNPASSVCWSSSEDLSNYRSLVCERFSAIWQFEVARKASWLALIVGICALIGVIALGIAAFVNRSVQYASFMIGRRLLAAVSVTEIIIQGSLAIWLSFWVTALLFDRYVPKLILLIGILAVVSMWISIAAVFRRVRGTHAVEGCAVSEQEAPSLWRHIKSSLN